MKKIKYSSDFRKFFRERVRFHPELFAKFLVQVELFSQGEFETVRVHKLNGSMFGLQSFSIMKDIRVIFKEENDHYLFLDIGTHKEVYKK